MVLLITYEVMDKSRNLLPLHLNIKSTGTWWHHIDNVWIIQTNDSPETWYKRIAPFFTQADHVFVTQITRNAFGYLPPQAWEWLRTVKF